MGLRTEGLGAYEDEGRAGRGNWLGSQPYELQNCFRWWNEKKKKKKKDLGMKNSPKTKSIQTNKEIVVLYLRCQIS